MLSVSIYSQHSLQLSYAETFQGNSNLELTEGKLGAAGAGSMDTCLASHLPILHYKCSCLLWFSVNLLQTIFPQYIKVDTATT